MESTQRTNQTEREADAELARRFPNGYVTLRIDGKLVNVDADRWHGRA